jgi:predicted hotdog family 3-hydroxylacyl-ACP dehydratase
MPELILPESPDPLTLLPHRFPLLLVDRITSVEAGKSARGIKTVTGNEWSTIGSSHDAGAQAMPHLLIVEALAQLSAAVLVTLLEHSQGAIGYFLGFSSARRRAGDEHRTATVQAWRLQDARRGARGYLRRGTRRPDYDHSCGGCEGARGADVVFHGVMLTTPA